jgi:hypothetical protein
MFLRVDDEGFWDNWPEEFAVFKDGVERLTTSKVALFPLGDITDNPPTAIAFYQPPGSELTPHSHDCVRFEVIARGEIHDGDDVYKAGDIMMSAPGVPYGPHYAGPDGVLTYEIFSNLKAAHQVTQYLDGLDHDPYCYDLALPGQMEQLTDDATRAAENARNAKA